MTPAIELSARELAILDKCWTLSDGKSWEPPSGTSFPLIQRFVAAGFLVVVDGRCGFEALKDAMVRWTQAGRLVMAARARLAGADLVKAANILADMEQWQWSRSDNARKARRLRPIIETLAGVPMPDPRVNKGTPDVL